MARSQDIPRSLTGCDPLLAVWLGYVQARGSDPRRPNLFIRCLLSRALGERQSPEWAACVLDAKRAYLENPRAVGVFTVIREPASVPQAVRDLGFELEPSLTVSIGQSLIHTAVLPFGPQGPMHWILEFVGSDLSREPVGSSKPQVELDVSTPAVGNPRWRPVQSHKTGVRVDVLLVTASRQRGDTRRICCVRFGSSVPAEAMLSMWSFEAFAENWAATLG